MDNVGRITSILKVLLALGARRIGSTASTAAMSLVILGLLLSLGARPASAQCNTWNGGNGNWSSANWTPGPANGFGGANNSIDVCITQSTATTVTLDINPSAANLTIGATDVLDIAPGFSLNLNGSQINNSGNIDLNGASGEPANLVLNSSETLSDGGKITLAYTTNPSPGPWAAISDGATSNVTLTNVDNTIQGIGQINVSHIELINEAAGTIDANVSQGTEVLNVNGFGAAAGVTNSGLMEATNGGTLLISNVSPDVINAGGNITANGGTVALSGETIQGGTLNQTNSGTLEALSGGVGLYLDGSNATYGAVTINGTFTDTAGATTNLLGTINNNNAMNFVSSSGNNANLGVAGNTTLQGGGTVTLSGPQAAIVPTGTPDLYTLTNVNNTIQGVGTISVAHLVEFDNQTGGTVNANVSGQTLLVDGFGGNGSVVNAGLMEASNGGTLTFNDTAASINNTGGKIEAGASSIVVLNGNSSTITGGIVDGTGTINAASGAGGTFTLSGGTITPGYSATSTPGTLSITGNFTQSNGGAFDEIISAAGYGVLDVSGNVTLDDGVLNINASGVTLETGETFDILDYDGTLSGTFSNGSDIVADGFNWYISTYDGAEAADPAVVLTVGTAISTGPTGVPEPGELPMLAIGLLALGAFSAKIKRVAAER
ncbi:MAG: hypothetical protein ABSA32_15440 [Candidatus Acidiferrales bacterium]|jgi:hypothetical protein